MRAVALVVSIQEDYGVDQSGAEICGSCWEYSDQKKPCCKRDLGNVHAEGEKIAQFYKRFDQNVAHLKNPDLGALMEAFERIGRRKQMQNQ